MKKKNLTLTLMALPAALVLFIFSYLPIGGLVIAFKEFRYDKGFLGSEWIGFGNFAYLFSSKDIWNVLKNTIFLNLVFISVTLIISVTVALLMNEVHNRGFIKAVQTIMFFPILCPGW